MVLLYFLGDRCIGGPAIEVQYYELGKL